MVQESIKNDLFIWFAASKTKYQKMPMRVCTGKMLSILGKLTVKHSSVSLSFDLGEPGERVLGAVTRCWFQHSHLTACFRARPMLMTSTGHRAQSTQNWQGGQRAAQSEYQTADPVSPATASTINGFSFMVLCEGVFCLRVYVLHGHA